MRNPEACARCGTNPAPGHAIYDGRRYCHGDHSDGATCFERVQWEAVATPLPLLQEDR